MYKLKFKIIMSKSLYISIITIFVALLSLLLIKIISDFYIIYKAEQTFKILQSAYSKALERTTFKWTYDDMETFIVARELIKDLPIKENCSFKNDDKCFPRYVNIKKPIRQNLKKTRYSTFEHYKFMLNNNVGVALNIIHPTCKDVRNRCGIIYIDINGPDKGPNKFGEDLYDFGIYKDGIRLYDLASNHLHLCIHGTGQACAAYMFKYKTRFYSLHKRAVRKMPAPAD